MQKTPGLGATNAILAITWANVHPDLCCHMASLGHNELTHWPLVDVVVIYKV